MVNFEENTDKNSLFDDNFIPIYGFVCRKRVCFRIFLQMFLRKELAVIK